MIIRWSAIAPSSGDSKNGSHPGQHPPRPMPRGRRWTIS